jgi:hypothetical protein
MDRPEQAIPRADHAFQAGPDLVSRPYGMGSDSVGELVDWCKRYGLEFDIDSPSSWHPATLVVRVWNPEFKQEFWVKVRSYGDAFELSMHHLIYDRVYAEITRVRRVFKDRDTGIFLFRSTVTTEKAYESKDLLEVGDFVEAKQGYSLGARGE